MSKFVRRFDCSVLRSLDVFVSNGKRPHNALVRVFTIGKLSALRRRDIGDHMGFLVSDHGQIAVSELGPKGHTLDQLVDYRTRWCQIIDVYRWEGFDREAVRESAERLLARQRRLTAERKAGYDWGGAPNSTPTGRRWVRVLFPWLKDNPKENYCSENVLEVLIAHGCPGPFPEWDNPEAMRRWMANRSDFKRISGYSLPM